MPRTYGDQNISKLTPLPSKAVYQGIPATARLLDIPDASAALTEQFGKGYSVTQIGRFIRGGQWAEGVHYIKRGKYYKIYLPAVQQWVVSGA